MLWSLARDGSASDAVDAPEAATTRCSVLMCSSLSVSSAHSLMHPAAAGYYLRYWKTGSACLMGIMMSWPPCHHHWSSLVELSPVHQQQLSGVASAAGGPSCASTSYYAAYAAAQSAWQRTEHVETMTIHGHL